MQKQVMMVLLEIFLYSMFVPLFFVCFGEFFHFFLNFIEV